MSSDSSYPAVRYNTPENLIYVIYIWNIWKAKKDKDLRKKQFSFLKGPGWTRSVLISAHGKGNTNPKLKVKVVQKKNVQPTTLLSSLRLALSQRVTYLILIDVLVQKEAHAAAASFEIINSIPRNQSISKFTTATRIPNALINWSIYMSEVIIWLFCSKRFIRRSRLEYAV